MIQISLCLVALMVLGLGVLVWRARPEAPANRSFGAVTFFSAVWIVGVAFLYSGGNLAFWARVPFVGASLLPAALLTFVRWYPTPTRWLGTSALSLGFSLGVFFAIVSLTTTLVVKDALITIAGPVRQTGALYPLFAVYFLLAWLVALVVLLSKWSRARGQARVQLLYLSLGFAVSTTGGIAANLVLPIVFGTSTYQWIGPLFSQIDQLIGVRRILKMSGIHACRTCEADPVHAGLKRMLEDRRIQQHVGCAFNGMCIDVTSAAVRGGKMKEYFGPLTDFGRKRRFSKIALNKFYVVDGLV